MTHHQSETDVRAFTTPDWVKHAVFYQIFPERFANGDPSNDPENVSSWGTPPTQSNYMGGDLRGIINHLDYLAHMGITALYLNPIFHAFSNHKYNTYNYFEIDPHFGDLATFHELVEQAHQRGIRVLLDGVFNHCGRGFFAFQSIIEQHADSPYVQWFHILQFPIHPYDASKPSNYACWWNIPSLPKFNTDHEPVRRYVLDVARYWIEQGADGWRLDVPDEIKDHSFWQEFRHVVKAANPDAYIVGEIWADASPWLEGTQFDAVMNYIFRDLCRDFFARETLSTEDFARGIEDLLQAYPWEATLAQLNLLGSHDTSRFRTEAQGDVNKLFATILFQMTFPGAPCIYYGDEIGLAGSKDPLCRGCFPWEEQTWDRRLLDWVQRCIALRRDHASLRTGHYRTLLTSSDPRVYAFARWNEDERLVIALNPTGQAIQLDLALDEDLFPGQIDMYDQMNRARYVAQEGKIAHLSIPAYGGTVLSMEGMEGSDAPANPRS